MKRTLIPFVLGLAIASQAQTFDLQSKRIRVGPNPTSIVLTDLNEDGRLDMLTTNRGRLMGIRDERPAEENVSYLVGRDEGAFDAQPPLPCGFGPYQAVVANIDALRAPDIVVVNFHAVHNRDLTLLRNLDAELFEPRHFAVPDDALRYTQTRDSEGQPYFSTPGLTAVAVADVNGDGYRDAIATGWASDVLVLFPGHAESYFSDPVLTSLPGGPRDLVIEDFDGDGAQDLAVTLYNTDEVALLRGAGEGEFDLVDKVPAHGKMPQKIRVADMNGDRRDDLVVTHAQSDDSIVILFGGGKFDFSLAQELRLGENRFQREFDIEDIVIRDFNQDGKPDVALACAEAGIVMLLRNTSSGKEVPLQFDHEAYATEGGQPHALAAGDVNRDGRIDLAAALWGSDSVAMLLNRP